MLTGFIRASDGLYYEGDQEHALDLVVPQRPNQWSTWDAKNGVWIVGADPALQAAAVAQAKVSTNDSALAALQAHVAGTKLLSQDDFNKLVVQILQGGDSV